MSTKLKLIEAAILREKGLALAELASAEALLEKIGTNPGDDYLELFTSHVKRLAEHERNMNMIQAYFTKPAQQQQKVPSASPPASPPPEPAGTEPITHDELMKRSPTYRESVKGKPKPKQSEHTENFKKSLKDKFNEKK